MRRNSYDKKKMIQQFDFAPTRPKLQIHFMVEIIKEMNHSRARTTLYYISYYYDTQKLVVILSSNDCIIYYQASLILLPNKQSTHHNTMNITTSQKERKLKRRERVEYIHYSLVLEKKSFQFQRNSHFSSLQQLSKEGI